MLSVPTFKYFIHFECILCMVQEKIPNFQPFTCSFPVSPTPYIEKTFLPFVYSFLLVVD